MKLTSQPRVEPHSVTVDAKKIAELKSQDHSCLTCHSTKKAYGTKLYCTLKSKVVDQYRICPHHTVQEPILNREEKELL